MTGFANACVVEAERLGLPVPPVVRFAVVALRVWGWQLAEAPPKR
jgi:hypothetical protein